MSPSAKRWVEAAKVLGADPSAKVRCPENDDGVLTVRDVRSGDALERYSALRSMRRTQHHLDPHAVEIDALRERTLRGIAR